VQTFREESSIPEGPAQGTGSSSSSRNPLGAIGNDAPAGKGKEEDNGPSSDYRDPLEGMAPIDKYGIKGLRTLMERYSDYHALTVGIDPNSLGLDLAANERLSEQVYSLFDDTPMKPAIPKFTLPECYTVKNVQPIEDKIAGFNEETLFWIFYSCPGDFKQQIAALELNSRNWRWHKKLQLWLTKDDLMIPHPLSSTSERGYYIIWDTVSWRKERREFTLHYGDLDNSLSAAGLLGQPA